MNVGLCVGSENELGGNEIGAGARPSSDLSRLAGQVLGEGRRLPGFDLFLLLRDFYSQLPLATTATVHFL